MAAFLNLLALIPELFSLAKLLVLKIEQGATLLQVKSELKRISAAFDNPDRRKAAEELDDVFRGKK